MSLAAFVRRVAGRLRGESSDAAAHDLDAEIQEHLERLADRFRRQGLAPDAAMQAARRQFGNITMLREEHHRMRALAPAVDSVWCDLRLAVRSLRRSPGFSLAVMVTLMLGIGGSTAVFSVYDAVLLKPFPYPDPDRVMMVWERNENDNRAPMPVAPANFRDWRDQTHAFSDLAAINPFPSFVLQGTGEPRRAAGAAVSWNLFRLLGTRFFLGRSFRADEDQPGRNRVAVLSYHTWTTSFGSRADIVGQSIALNGVAFTVVGVLPADFELIVKPSDFQGRNEFDVWVPLALSATPSRGTHPLRVFARLAPSASVSSAQTELDALAATLERAYPEDNRRKGIVVVPLREQVTHDARSGLTLLLAALGCLLLIACANVANLLLARSAARSRDVSVRLAIGAGRWRVAQPALIESLLLALGGGLLGLALAALLLHAVVPNLPAALPRAAAVTIDLRVIAFAGFVSAAVAILFGTAPVIQFGRIPASAALTPETRVSTNRATTRLRGVLVVAQITITVVLLVGAGLMSRSLWTLLAVPTGFATDHVLTARVTLPRTTYGDRDRSIAFQRALLERLRAMPDVQAAALASYLPLSGEDNGWAFFIEGRPPAPPGVYDVVKYRPVTDGYFAAVGLPVIRGRAFTPRDSIAAPDVVMINAAMARMFWGTQDPVGQRIQFGGPNWRSIVGIVGDVRHEGLDQDLKPEMYVPFAQAPDVETAPSIVVRARTQPMAIAQSVRAAVAAVDPAIPVDQMRTMDAIVARSVGEPRFRALLLGLVAVLALALATVGVYGVTNYVVVQRRREFGIYQAMGATPRAILRLAFSPAAVLTACGVGGGLVASMLATRLLQKLLYGITPLDPITFLAAPALLVLVASIGTYIPARRAARIDPIIALRIE